MHAHHLVKLEPPAQAHDFGPGDTVGIHFTIREGDRTTTQLFQGVVIRKRGGQTPGATFTVRRVAYGVGIERTFPLFSPNLKAVEVLRRGKVRRARLYYLRGLSGRAARIKERTTGPLPPEAEKATAAPEGPEAGATPEPGSPPAA